MPVDIRKIIIHSKSVVMFKVKQGRKWLKTKLQRRDISEKQPQRGVVIVCHLGLPSYLLPSRALTNIQGLPTNFRRAEMTLGTNCEGKPVLVEQAREDAQSLFHASRSGSWDEAADARKI